MGLRLTPCHAPNPVMLTLFFLQCTFFKLAAAMLTCRSMGGALALHPRLFFGDTGVCCSRWQLPCSQAMLLALLCE